MKNLENLLNGEVLNEPVSDKQVELAKHLFSSLESQVMLADRKVQAVFGLNAFLVAAISLQSQESISALINRGLSFNVIIDLLLKAIFLACVCTATWSAVKALTPRVRTIKNPNDKSKESLFFFGDIRKFSFTDFSSAFIQLTNEEAVRELLTSAYSVSGILNEKYRMLKQSTMAISIALFIWVLIQVNKFMV